RPNPVPMNRWLTLGALNPKEWSPLMGARWSRKAGRIEVDGVGAGFGGRSLCLSEQLVPKPPYEICVTVKLDDESGAAGLAFESDGGDRHFGFYPTAGQMRLTRFDGPSVFSWTILKEFKTAGYKPGEWNEVKVRVETNRIVGFVNGERVVEASGEALREGRAGLAKFRDTKAQFKDFRIGAQIETAPVERISNAERAAVSKHLRENSGRTDAELLASLQSHPAANHPYLLERARALDKEAQQMRRVAAALHTKTVAASLVEALKRPEEHIDLFHAALLIARLDNPELETDAYRSELARMASELQGSLPNNTDDKMKVQAISKYLFTDNGFHGSRTDYYNRVNSYMNDVMDDREGLPITLSVLYLELARKMGMTNVVGVPVPTHFMVSFRPANEPEQLIDVFENGKVLTRSQAVELVAENVESIGEQDFRPATKQEIITRMLRNLLGLAQRDGNGTDAVRYLDVILALNPESAPDRLTRARYQMQRGDHAAAKGDVQWLIENEPPGVELDPLRELYRSL
ncbi:MAG TPA: transglutaminase family protein, partial [Methylomirabilota bacterium]|nr:transglutaminase family protein [Methylomirabilota bacterium]